MTPQHTGPFWARFLGKPWINSGRPAAAGRTLRPLGSATLLARKKSHAMRIDAPIAG
jgi:hypothetical protein